jgi:tRNA-splicing ligase RtcB
MLLRQSNSSPISHCKRLHPPRDKFLSNKRLDAEISSFGFRLGKAAASLFSTVHGAGLVLGRKMAAGVYDRKTGACKREGLVKPEMMSDWLQKSNVVLKGGGLDESPHCYKRLPEVLAAHASTIRILHTLTPSG